MVTSEQKDVLSFLKLVQSQMMTIFCLFGRYLIVKKKKTGYNLHHHVRHEQILGKFVCVSSLFTANKGEINEEKLIA